MIATTLRPTLLFLTLEMANSYQTYMLVLISDDLLILFIVKMYLKKVIWIKCTFSFQTKLCILHFNRLDLEIVVQQRQHFVRDTFA